MGKLDSKVAVITGAAFGNGRGMALRFAADGADVRMSLPPAPRCCRRLLGPAFLPPGRSGIANLSTVRNLFARTDHRPSWWMEWTLPGPRLVPGRTTAAYTSMERTGFEASLRSRES